MIKVGFAGIRRDQWDRRGIRERLPPPVPGRRPRWGARARGGGRNASRGGSGDSPAFSSGSWPDDNRSRPALAPHHGAGSREGRARLSRARPQGRARGIKSCARTNRLVRAVLRSRARDRVRRAAPSPSITARHRQAATTGPSPPSGRAPPARSRSTRAGAAAGVCRRSSRGRGSRRRATAPRGGAASAAP